MENQKYHPKSQRCPKFHLLLRLRNHRNLTTMSLPLLLQNNHRSLRHLKNLKSQTMENQKYRPRSQRCPKIHLPQLQNNQEMVSLVHLVMDTFHMRIVGNSGNVATGLHMK
jgi:hypothetical protein